MEQSVPKRWHIKFRSLGITEKKTYNKSPKALITAPDNIFWITED